MAAAQAPAWASPSALRPRAAPGAQRLCPAGAASPSFGPCAARGALSVRCMAKGGKKGAGGKKAASSIPKPGKAGGGEGAAAPPPAAPYTQGEIIMHSLEVIDSYFRAVGSPIFPEPVEVVHAAKALWEAPFVVISHGTEEDPIFNYGNALALDLFCASWGEFTAMPSHKSCQQGTSTAREQLLSKADSAAVDLKGIVRVTTQGRLFEVDEGVVWTLVASDGEKFGQAAVLRQWHFLDEEEAEEGAKEGSAEPQSGGAPASALETPATPAAPAAAPPAPAVAAAVPAAAAELTSPTADAAS